MVNAIPSTTGQNIKEMILIISDSEFETSEIVEYLTRNNYEIRTAVFDGRTLKDIPKSSPSAVLCGFSKPFQSMEKLVRTLKTRYSPRNVPFIGALASENEDITCFDSLIFPPAHPIQIANRVNSMVRLNTMQTEIALRIDTLKNDFDIDYDLSEMSFEDPFRVLFIGKATPEFMVVINALQNKHVEVVAAFTSFSAFDFLHEHAFDAVVMNALKNIEPAMTISETMRRNSKLFHVPNLFLIDDNFDASDMAYEKGATDIISSSCSEDQISGRILELANYHRIHRQLKSEFARIGSETCFDVPSRTYSGDFFKAHLSRASAYYPTQSLPLSLITIEATPVYDGHIDPEFEKIAYDQLGEMIRNMVRMQDAVGRLSDNKFAISFPGQEKIRLKSVIDRLFNMMDCAAFNVGPDTQISFRMKVDANLSQLADGESAEDLLERTLGSKLPDDMPAEIDILSANDPEETLTRQQYI